MFVGGCVGLAVLVLVVRPGVGLTLGVSLSWLLWESGLVFLGGGAKKLSSVRFCDISQYL